MKKIRWGIVGPGIIANEFARDFEDVKNAQITAVASHSAERAEGFAKKFNIPHVYNSYEELYSSNEIDAVYVATPHTFHYQNSAYAINSGKAVLCEKPLTPSLAETEKLSSLAESKDVYLAEGMWTRHLPAIKKALQWFNDGRIGKLLKVKADFGYKKEYEAENRLFNPKLAGGVMLDMGCYTTAITNFFINEKPTSLNVICKKSDNIVDTDVNALLKYESGKIAVLAASFDMKLHNWAFIVGTDAYIAIPDFWCAKEVFLYDENGIIDRFKEERNGFGFQYQIENISSDLLKGKTQPNLFTHEDSLKNASLLDNIISRF